MTLVQQTTMGSFFAQFCETEAVNDEPTFDVLSDININEDDPEQTVNLTGITAGGARPRYFRLQQPVTTQV